MSLKSLRFLTVFLLIGFAMKVLGEVVHELMGHGLLVLLFGGTISSVHISLLWPYELSGIGFIAPPGGFQTWERALIDGGGILACLLVSFISQALLLSRLSNRMHWLLSSTLLWLGFWTFINPAGYLIIGGIEPFGDIANLISAGFMTQTMALVLGLLIFLVGFLSLSRALKLVLRQAGVTMGEKWSLAIFWSLIPLITALTLIGRGGSLLFLPLSFIPVALGYAWPALYRLLFSRRKSREE